MIASLRQLFHAREADVPAMAVPSLPPGQRVYAVGDIHGRADLLAALIAAIDDDDARRNRDRDAAATTIVLLGDLIDRGPDSALVLSLAQDWQQRRRVRILCGNHEDMLLESLTDLDTLRGYLRWGGTETVLSFGIAQHVCLAATHEQLQALMAGHIPKAVLAFIRSFEDQVRIGDYLFVHAGIRPGVPLDQQQRADLLWIREPFLSHDGDFGAVVVHGHTIAPQVEFRDNRIGIDTGAYASGILTAIGLEGDRRWLIETCESTNGIATLINYAA